MGRNEDMEEDDLLERAADLAAEIRQHVDNAGGDAWRLSPLVRDLLTVLVAAHGSYNGKGYDLCGATWRTGNFHRPPGAVCADPALDLPWPSRAHGGRFADVPVCRHHRDRLEKEAYRFVDGRRREVQEALQDRRAREDS